MPYRSINGSVFEKASKIGHNAIINDPDVKKYLENCQVQPRRDIKSTEEIMAPHLHQVSGRNLDRPIKYVVTVDSGKTFPVEVGNGQISVVKFSILFFEIDVLDKIKNYDFVDQRDLKQMSSPVGPLKLVLPISNIGYNGGKSTIDSFRLTLYDFLLKNKLFETIRWLFQQGTKYENPVGVIIVCPNQTDGGVCQSTIPYEAINQRFVSQNSYKTVCKDCNKFVYLSDIFGFDRQIEYDSISNALVDQLVSIIESLLIFNMIEAVRSLEKPIQLSDFLFMVDGRLMYQPIVFTGALANKIHPYLKILRQAFKSINQQETLNLIGIEKSGPFQRWALKINEPQSETSKLIPANHYLILDKSIIYSEIILRAQNRHSSYGSSSHYGSPMVFKTKNGRIYNLTIAPWSDNPKQSTFKNIDNILQTLDKLQCHYYKNAVLPIVLVNKTASLSFRPSRVILQRFFKDKIRREE